MVQSHITPSSTNIAEWRSILSGSCEFSNVQESSAPSNLWPISYLCEKLSPLSVLFSQLYVQAYKTQLCVQAYKTTITAENDTEVTAFKICYEIAKSKAQFARPSTWNLGWLLRKSWRYKFSIPMDKLKLTCKSSSYLNKSNCSYQRRCNCHIRCLPKWGMCLHKKLTHVCGPGLEASCLYHTTNQK